MRSDVSMRRDSDLVWRTTQLAQRLRGFFRSKQDLHRISVDSFPGPGESGPAAAHAIEQRLPELCFECFDVSTDRWLGNAELHRREIEAAAINDGFEDTQTAGAC